MDVVITAAVEGIVDEAVVRRLVEHAGAIPGDVYGKSGKASIRQKIRGYNSAARYGPWIVLVDLDDDFDCAPPLRAELLGDPAVFMCFRVAVREVEAWLMGDTRGIASFLRVSRDAIPSDPETLDNPKEAMVNLARRSRSRDIREDMVPRIGSGRAAGPAYSSRLIEFAFKHWNPDAAAGRCDSLMRAIECLRRLVQSYRESGDA